MMASQGDQEVVFMATPGLGGGGGLGLRLCVQRLLLIYVGGRNDIIFNGGAGDKLASANGGRDGFFVS